MDWQSCRSGSDPCIEITRYFKANSTLLQWFGYTHAKVVVTAASPGSPRTRYPQDLRSPHYRSYIMVITDLLGKPFQLKFVRPPDMLLFANSICEPPLGQATVVPHGQQSVRLATRQQSEWQW